MRSTPRLPDRSCSNVSCWNSDCDFARRSHRSMHHIESQHHCYHRRGSVVPATILMAVTFLGISLSIAFVRAQQAQLPAADLTGNWVARTPNADGTFRLTYFNLKQEGLRITG